MHKRTRDIGKIMRERTLVDQALRRGAYEAYLKHKKAGLPMVIWRDGAICWVMPEELESQFRDQANLATS